MNKLIDALSGFDKEIREEIVNDYEDHFVNGLRSGKTEDEIAEELGSIEELISDLNALCGRSEACENAEKAAECGGRSDNDNCAEGSDGDAQAAEGEAGKSSFSEDASAKIDEMIKNFATLIGEVAAGINKGTKKVSSTVGEGARKVSSTVGEGAKKVSSSVGDGAKDFAESAKGFANNFVTGFMKGYENIAQGVGNMTDKVKNSEFVQGISESYRKSMNRSADAEKEEATEDIDDFDLDDELHNAADNITRIFSEAEDEINEEPDEFDEDENSEFVSFSEDIENVVIEVESADVFLDTSDDDSLNFNYENDGNPNQKLLYRFDVKQKGKTLYATVKKQNSLSNFFQTLGSPDISLYVGLNDSVKKVSVRTMSGDVNAEEIDIEQLKINSMSGDIDVSDCSIITTELSTMSGDVNVTLDEGSALSVSSISGDIDFEGTCESIHAKTTSGDIDFTIDNENSDITVSSVSGDIDIELQNDNGFVANVKSTAGSINLTCGDDEKEVSRSGSYIMGDGGAKLSLSSISGDIDVNA